MSYWYERMTAADRSFLVFEEQHTHMHVGGTTIFAGGSLVGPDGGVDVERIRDYIASRLHLIPRYRQRLAWTPVEGHPLWVDDDRLNPRYHVRHAALPRPGDSRALRRLVGQIMSQPLDRRRPLWEVWIIEGLEDHRFAMVLKTHHCVVDGISGVDLMSVLLRTDPDDAFDPGPAWSPRSAPTPLQLLREEVGRRVTTVASVAQEAAGWLRRLPEAPERLAETASTAWDFLRSGLHAPAETPINGPIGPYRRCDWTSLDLAEVKQVKNRLGCTVNDVILATVSGALRRYLLRRGTRVDAIDFRIVVPVSTRTPGEMTAMGNRVSAWLMSLPIEEADPRARCRRLAETTSSLKRSKQAHGMDAFAQVAELFDPIVTLGVRIASTLHPYNLIVSNVPGPQFPLYLLGARMVEGYPVVPLFEHQGLGIATFSYDGRLHWGLNACWDLLPDLHTLVDDVGAAFSELRDAARAGEGDAPERAVS